MAKDPNKTPLHQHEHPLYPWLALFFSLFVILGVAGWYYLTYLDTLNAETDSTVSSAYSTTIKSTVVGETKTTPSATNTDQASVDQSVSAIDSSINGVSNDDFSDSGLGSSAIGVQ